MYLRLEDLNQSKSLKQGKRILSDHSYITQLVHCPLKKKKKGGGGGAVG